MERPQFTTRDMLLATALICFAMWLVTWPQPRSFAYRYLQLAGMTAIGTGIFTLLREKRLSRVAAMSVAGAGLIAMLALDSLLSP